MKAHVELAKHAINTMGFSISVDDGEPEGELTVVRSSSVNEVVAACEGVDESHMFFFDADGTKKGWAFIVLGNDGGDEVSDYGVIDWIETFMKEVVL